MKCSSCTLSPSLCRFSSHKFRLDIRSETSCIYKTVCWYSWDGECAVTWQRDAECEQHRLYREDSVSSVSSHPFKVTGTKYIFVQQDVCVCVYVWLSITTCFLSVNWLITSFGPTEAALSHTLILVDIQRGPSVWFIIYAPFSLLNWTELM